MNITMPDSHSCVLHILSLGVILAFSSQPISLITFFLLQGKPACIRLERIIITTLKLHCCSAMWGRNICIFPGVELYKWEWNRLLGLIFVFRTPLTHRKLEFLGTVIEQDFSKSLNNGLSLFS